MKFIMVCILQALNEKANEKITYNKLYIYTHIINSYVTNYNYYN